MTRDTSLQAFESVKPDLNKLQAVVLQFARSHPDGFTDEQMNQHFACTRSTYRTRRAELTVRGLLVDTGRREKMDSGKKAIVWAVKEGA